ncbi:MAG: DUF1659 domain-containing protein [Paraclostridium sp.]|uniref:DUF1659 domain-containing protein n=1 Tax=Paraclostridium sp. TaxID=2023273 RepID=UPI003F2B2182
MAVSETKNPSTLKLKFDCGLDDNGKTIVKNRSYSNVKSDANAQDSKIVVTDTKDYYLVV